MRATTLVAIILLGGALPTQVRAQFVPEVSPDAPTSGFTASFLQSTDAWAAALNRWVRLPREVRTTFTRCGRPSAFYQRDPSRVVVCLELADALSAAALRSLVERVVAAGVDTTDVAAMQAFVRGHDAETYLAMGPSVAQLFFVELHEVGHALVDVLDLPVVGQEEDAADQLAALLLAREPLVAMWAAQFWRTELGGAGRPLAGAAFADEHDLSEQRFFNIACWTFGADPLVRGYIATLLALPQERARRCEAEFQQLRSSWQRILQPHLVNASWMDSVERDAQGYWRYVESMQDSEGTVRCTASGELLVSELVGILGEMSGRRSCVWSGVPIANPTGTRQLTGTAEGINLTLSGGGCAYDGTMAEPDRLEIDGNVSCSLTLQDGINATVTGRWTAVR